MLWVQRGARGRSCLTRAGQGEPSPAHFPAQLPAAAGATKWHILTSSGEEGDIQQVSEGSWQGWGPIANLGRVPQGGDTAPSELKARLEEDVPAQGKAVNLGITPPAAPGMEQAQGTSQSVTPLLPAVTHPWTPAGSSFQYNLYWGDGWGSEQGRV